jgi:WD40 repeat protein
MSVFGHLDDRVLARLAGSDGPTDDLTARERDHLGVCARCEGLLRGHRLALRLLSGPWQLVPVSAVAGAGAPTLDHPPVLLGPTLRRRTQQGRLPWPWTGTRRRIGILIALALLALAAGFLLLLGGGSDGSRPGIVLFSANGRVSIVNASTLAVTDLGPAWSADRRTVALIDNDRLVGVNVATGHRADLGPFSYEWLAVSRGGRWILLTSGGHVEDLSILVDSTTGARRTLAEGGLKDTGPPAWSASSDRAVMVGPDGKGLLLLDLHDPAVLREIPIGIRDTFKGSVAWGPSDALAYFTPAGLETIQLDGSNKRLLSATNPGEFVLTPAWSPDGRWIAFGLLNLEREPGQVQVMVVDVATGAIRSLATGEAGLLEVIGWSEDPQALQIGIRSPSVDQPKAMAVRWLRLDGFVLRSIELGPGVEGVVR